MKIGDLVKSADPWGPDGSGGKIYYPIGIVYRQHKYRPTRWWVEWLTHGLAGEKECMRVDWLEVLSENR